MHTPAGGLYTGTMTLRYERLPKGDLKTLREIADLFELPPSYIRQKARQLLGKDVDNTTLVDRFRIERELDNGTIKGARWAAALLGLTKATFDACLEHEGLSTLPMPSGILPRRKQSGEAEDQRRIFSLKILADWATKLIEEHLGYAITFSNVTSKALKLREALRSAGIEQPEVQFCTFESAHLAQLKINPDLELDRVVASTLCYLSEQPIWEGYGCWLDYGKPMSLRPDLVSYEEVLKDTNLRRIIQPASYEHFIRLVEAWGVQGVAS